MTELNLIEKIQNLITDNTNQKIQKLQNIINELNKNNTDLANRIENLQDKISCLDIHHNTAINIHSSKIRDQTELIDKLQNEIILMKREKVSLVKSNEEVISEFIKTRDSVVNQITKTQNTPEESESIATKMRRSKRPSQITAEDKNKG